MKILAVVVVVVIAVVVVVYWLHTNDRRLNVSMIPGVHFDSQIIYGS